MRTIARATLTATRPGGTARPTAPGWAEVGMTPETLAWHANAACRQVDPALFFVADETDQDASVTGEAAGVPSLRAGSVPVAAAKRVCLACPVRAVCLASALERDERFGIWGGLTTRQRRALGHRPVPQPSVLDREVARLTRAGRSAREIAEALSVTERTVCRARARNRAHSQQQPQHRAGQEAA